MNLSQYNSLMKHTITLNKKNRNESGDFSIISSSTIKGFVQYGNNLVIEKNGEKIVCTAIVFLKNDCGIDIDHLYWSIDQISPQTRENMEVIKIDPIDDPINGGLTHHYEIIVK